MRGLSTLLGACALSLAAVPAQAATTIITPLDQPPGTSFIVAGDSTMGEITASFGHVGIVAGNFTDLFQFIIDQTGLGSGSITTSVSFNNFQGRTDTDLLSVSVNGQAATRMLSDANGLPCEVRGVGTCGANETYSINDIVIVNGALNTIQIDGFSRGNGSFGGNATFTPAITAVPEPSTWAMLILGFGVVGYSLRRRRNAGYRLRFA